MATASQALARFAADLKYRDIPAAVIERAKDCIIDTVAAATFGSTKPWSRMVANYAASYGPGGPCSILGTDGVKVHAPSAALANGVFAHAFEQDSVSEPGMGMHAGATMVPALFAVAQQTGANGETILRAFVAGCEVMARVAIASQHSPEKLGFHSPGVTGPYGAAVAASIVLGLDESKITNAIGIAGSLSSGLLAFSKSKQGGMIKRLHLGRASESGVLAASLAASGYEGPETVLEGRLGFLEAFCSGHPIEPPALTAGLGEQWNTLRISLKRYACHVTAHTSVQSIRELMAEHGFTAADVETVSIDAHERVSLRHNILEPGDIMQAQYSLPFCVALALHRNPNDPRSFDESAVKDAAILATARKVTIVPWKGPTAKSVRLSIRLKDGRELARACDTFKGMPQDPLSRDELRAKFMLLTKDIGEDRAAALFDRLNTLEKQERFSLA